MKKLRESNSGFSPMNMLPSEQKIVLIAKRVRKSFPNKSSSEVYRKFVRDSLYRPIYESLSTESFIMLCFLVANIEESDEVKDIIELYNRIKGSTFVFSTVRIDNDEAAVTCDYCNGDGSEDCEWCGGRGDLECDDCNGEGTIEGDDGDETCDRCDGDGRMSCDECGGDGYNPCDKCGGSGDVMDDDLSEITQSNYISFDSKLLGQIEVLDNMDDISEEIIIDSLGTKKTIMLSEISGESSQFNDNDSGDELFVGFDRDGFGCVRKFHSGIDVNCLEVYPD